MWPQICKGKVLSVLIHDVLLLKADFRDEVKRNRAKVLEINHFLDIQREEFEELHNTIVGPAIDPDITAALS